MCVPSSPSSDDLVQELRQKIESVFPDTPEGEVSGQEFFEQTLDAIAEVAKDENRRNSSG